MLDEHLNEPDQAPLHCMDSLPAQIISIKENGILAYDTKIVVLRGDQLFQWITDENLNVHSVLIEGEKYFTLRIHDGTEVWAGTFCVNNEPVEQSL